MTEYKKIPIQVDATFTPEDDNTSFASTGYISMDKIRIFDGVPETLGGYTSVSFDNSATVSGVCRFLYSQLIANKGWLLIGTHQKLYSNLGTELTNITPLVAATTALGANPVTTYFPTLGSNPLTTVSSSTTVTVSQTAHRFEEGDTITMAGVPGAVNGIPVGELNKAHIIRSTDTNSYTIIVSTSASSSGTGGGGAVTIASGLVTIAHTSHGNSDGDRVKIGGATATGGITAAQINIEHIIRNSSTNEYDVMTAGTSTSGATGGGAGVTVQYEISDGQQDASTGVGYGAGQYGSGQYGSALQSSSLNVLPRIWSGGPYGAATILTPGGQTGVYRWDADPSTAPTLVTNAPTAVNYVFTDREFIITLGASATTNRVKTSDRGQSTVWTATAQNQAFEDDVESAGTFKSHATIRGVNYLFTDTEVYAMRYRGRPIVWDIKRRLPVGIIAQNARVVVEEICYFMSQNNFYEYDGSTLRPLLTDKVRAYVFDNINRVQQSKCFAEYRENFSEVIFRWPSSTATEPDRYLRYNIRTASIAAGTKARTAAEQPAPLNPANPRMIDSGGTVYLHESGDNTDSWHLETNYGFAGDSAAAIHGVIPDSIQTGDVSFVCKVKDFPQTATADIRTAVTLTVTSTTEESHFDETIMRGSLRNYRLSGSAQWRAGGWQELVAPSTRRVD